MTGVWLRRAAPNGRKLEPIAPGYAADADVAGPGVGAGGWIAVSEGIFNQGRAAALVKWRQFAA